MSITNDVFETFQYSSDSDDEENPGGLRLKWPAGSLVHQSVIDAAFGGATVTGVSPATGAAAGGTVVTLTGTNLDGVTAVTFGGNAGTALSVQNPNHVRVTTPAHAAGAVNVVVTDDSGTVTKTNAFTYT